MFHVEHQRQNRKVAARSAMPYTRPKRAAADSVFKAQSGYRRQSRQRNIPAHGGGALGRWAVGPSDGTSIAPGAPLLHGQNAQKHGQNAHILQHPAFLIIQGLSLSPMAIIPPFQQSCPESAKVPAQTAQPLAVSSPECQIQQSTGPSAKTSSRS